jgi:hypothetical protein
MNDKRFNNKTWSNIQVHGAVVAMLTNLNTNDSYSSTQYNPQQPICFTR